MTWFFCANAQCAGDRMVAGLLGIVAGRAITADERRLLNWKARAKQQQAQRWNAKPAAQAARRRWKEAHPDQVAAQARQLAERHRRRMNAIARSNAAYRDRLWAAARAEAEGELRELIEAQSKDRERVWTLPSLDMPIDERHALGDFVAAGVSQRHLIEWHDPTFDMVCVLLRIQEAA
jgi:hypothetical protein